MKGRVEGRGEVLRMKEITKQKTTKATNKINKNILTIHVYQVFFSFLKSSDILLNLVST